MNRKYMVAALTVGLILLLGLSTIPVATSDSGSGGARQDNIAPYAKPSSSGGGQSQYGYGPENMNDLNTYNMHWVSTPYNYAPADWFQLTWSQKYTIGSMYVIQHGSWSHASNRNLWGCDIQYWDGAMWVTDGTLSNMYANFQYTFVNTPTTDSIRISNLRITGNQASNPCVYEWYVYEGEGGIAADVKLEPQSLNLDSNGNYVSYHVLGFPEDPDYTPYDVDPTSIEVEGVNTDLKYGTVNNNKFIGKADRLLVEDAIGAPGEEVEVKVRGQLYDSTVFEGTAVIKAL